MTPVGPQIGKHTAKVAKLCREARHSLGRGINIYLSNVPRCSRSWQVVASREGETAQRRNSTTAGPRPRTNKWNSQLFMRVLVQHSFNLEKNESSVRLLNCS